MPQLRCSAAADFVPDRPLRTLIGSCRFATAFRKRDCRRERRRYLLFPFAAVFGGDQRVLRDSRAQRVHVWLQPAGPETAGFRSIRRCADALYYDLPGVGCAFAFQPSDFTQGIRPSTACLSRAAAPARPAAGQRVADLFCGIATSRCRWPCGRAGDSLRGQRPAGGARAENAAANGLVAQSRPPTCSSRTWAPTEVRQVLIDPPREGAIISSIHCRGLAAPIVLRVLRSRHPGTRCGCPGHAKGFRAERRRVVNMFPHTGTWNPLRCSIADNKKGARRRFLSDCRV